MFEDERIRVCPTTVFLVKTMEGPPTMSSDFQASLCLLLRMGKTWHSSSHEDKCLRDLVTFNPASTYQLAYYDKTQSFFSSLRALAQHPCFCTIDKNLWMIACRGFSIFAVYMHNSIVLWEELKKLEVFSALLHCCIQSWRNFDNQSRFYPAGCN